MKIAILGWGSLLWDPNIEFNKRHGVWHSDGPLLKLEFCRVSESRKNALTLVLAPDGAPCQVAYTFSKRNNPDDAICDLRSREGTTHENIGLHFKDKTRKQSKDDNVSQTIEEWALAKSIDVTIWTDLEGNFKTKSSVKRDFDIDAAIAHLQALKPDAKAMAAEYIWRAPEFIDTPLRRAMQTQDWFPNRI